MEVFDDDEPIVAPEFSGTKPTPIIAGKIKATYTREKDEAPLQESSVKVLVELTGDGDAKARAGLDLVAVLDVSKSMEGVKLTKMKRAMQFLIKKLGPDDRLSVVTFARNADKRSSLRRMTANNQAQIENLVNGLSVSFYTNIIAGLEKGKQVLNGRKIIQGREAAIMLMSDGEDNVNYINGVLQVPIPTSNVPVYTFGFGKDQDAKLLTDIARNSPGGTFSDVQDENLNIAFSQCLGGLLTTVVQDLELTLKPLSSPKFKQVLAGTYQQSNNADGSVTFSFGNLYSNELRSVIVDLFLPEVKRKTGSSILEFKYSYRYPGVEELFRANPITVRISRTKTPSGQREVKIMVEEDRLRTIKAIKDSIAMADSKNLVGARKLLDDTQNSLHDADYETNELIETLKYELKLLLGFMRSQKIYEEQGRPFALSCETSHDRQRFATRGDVERCRMYATPRMNDYKEQAKVFDMDPSKPPPTVDEDVKEELAADPFAPIVGPLGYHHGTAIQSLKENDAIVENIKTIQDLEIILGNVDKAIQALQQIQSAAIPFLLEHLRNIEEFKKLEEKKTKEEL